MNASYRESPAAITTMPPGIPYIVGNEAAERFSFYGMKAILAVFMTRYMLDGNGSPDFMTDDDATGWIHLWTMLVYATPLLGAVIADVFFGKFRTIIALSAVYCVGHLALAVNDTRVGLAIGLSLIALGSGGIKPCVSAHVGDQFGRSNQSLVERVFGWFYFAINFGAFFSQALTPFLLDRYGPRVAFGVPGVLMLIATFVFWAGRWKFVHVPPRGWQAIQEIVSPAGRSALGRLAALVVFIAFFWSLFDQSSSRWVLQAERLDLQLFGVTILPSQLQAANPILVLAFVPLFSYALFPWLDRTFGLNPLRKMGIGFFLAALAFVIPAWIETRLSAGATVHMVWQLVAYVLLTAAEIFVSVTGLEFFYTQAPPRIKSSVMALYMFSVAIGNAFTSGVNFFLRDDSGKVYFQGASYYLFFAALMLLAALAFIPFARRFEIRTYLQDEAA